MAKEREKGRNFVLFISLVNATKERWTLGAIIISEMWIFIKIFFIKLLFIFLQRETNAKTNKAPRGWCSFTKELIYKLVSEKSGWPLKKGDLKLMVSNHWKGGIDSITRLPILSFQMRQKFDNRVRARFFCQLISVELGAKPKALNKRSSQLPVSVSRTSELCCKTEEPSDINYVAWNDYLSCHTSQHD